ncbi:MAG: mannose-1-phosphate guanylyltransferase [Oligoflexia bacterium]
MTSPHLVVMAGGSGTRFWPKSTSKRPKQLLSFEGISESRGSASRTLLEQTLDRFTGWISDERRWIVTTSQLKQAVQEQSGGAKVLAEPQGRNTAPCIYWAAREIAAADPQGMKAVMLVMPADHLIQDVASFLAVVRAAAHYAAESTDLVTLGVKPTRPETGYGYLKLGAPLKSGSSAPNGAFKLDAFVEKPDLDRARRFLTEGTYLWNGGMFVWQVGSILAEFDRWMPEMKKAWDSSNGVVEKAYPLMTATSIDFGVMEKARSVVTYRLDCGWDDLGSWTSVELLARARGGLEDWGVGLSGQVTAVDSRGLVIDVPGRQVAALGVEDLILVETDSVLLVAKKDRAQDIKKLVDAVKCARPELV